MATLVTVTVTITDTGGLTQSQATVKVADVIRVFQGNTVTPTYSSAAVALAVS
jgi:hypothetical protein